MWYGKDTPELEKLNREYKELFGHYPFEYDELDYGDKEYKRYIRDIEKAIKCKKELPDVVD